MLNWSPEKDKLRQLILYVASRSANETRGDTFLNKMLFFSDAWALQHLGAPITQSRYQKLPFGPASVNLMPVRQDMIEEGLVAVEMVGKTRVTRALREPDLSEFSTDEIKLVDEVFELFKGLSATRLSDISHDLAPGWNLVGTKEDIPLHTQFLSTKPPPDSVLERGRELAATHGW